MPKSVRQKLKLIYTLDILRKYSDEENPLSANEICDYLEQNGISAERKSVYSDIEALCEYGYDIIRSFTAKKGFFLASREFEEAEIYLLCDAVRTAKFISPKKTRELVSKLDNMLSKNQLLCREKNIYFDSQQKCQNEEIYYNIDKISRAISKSKKIKLKYTARKLSGREIEKSVKEMLVSPYALTWQDDHYYLIGNYDKYDNLIHIRLDRISGVEITEIKSRHFSEVSDYKDFFDVSDYTNRLFDMHSGSLETIELCCNKRITEQVFDRFSENIFITNVTEDEFCFSYKAAISEALVTFILNFGDSIKVVKPKELQNMVQERIKKVLDLYKN
jgi:predicted DNA-binding transcriptional regulator YafY